MPNFAITVCFYLNFQFSPLMDTGDDNWLAQSRTSANFRRCFCCKFGGFRFNISSDR